MKIQFSPAVSLVTASLAMGTLSACSVAPSSIIQNPGPTPTRAMQSQPATGGIYSNATFRPIFDGNRARAVGDTVTVLVAESTQSKTTLNNQSGKTASSSATAQDQFGNTVSPTWAWNNSLSNQNKGGGQQDNSFSGSITATVIEVLPGGNLVVVGEKQLGFDEGAQFIRFSGVVYPKMITVNNTVDSSTVAEARIEYRTNNTIDASYMASSITRFFKTMLPF